MVRLWRQAAQKMSRVASSSSQLQASLVAFTQAAEALAGRREGAQPAGQGGLVARPWEVGLHRRERGQARQVAQAVAAAGAGAVLEVDALSAALAREDVHGSLLAGSLASGTPAPERPARLGSGPLPDAALRLLRPGLAWSAARPAAGLAASGAARPAGRSAPPFPADACPGAARRSDPACIRGVAADARRSAGRARHRAGRPAAARLRRVAASTSPARRGPPASEVSASEVSAGEAPAIEAPASEGPAREGPAGDASGKGGAGRGRGQRPERPRRCALATAGTMATVRRQCPRAGHREHAAWTSPGSAPASSRRTTSTW